MSVSYYAYAAIGCKVPIEKAKREVQTRECQHEIIIDNQRNCPYCDAKHGSQQLDGYCHVEEDRHGEQ